MPRHDARARHAPEAIDPYDSGDRVYSRKAMFTPGMVQTISTYGRRLKVMRSRDGLPAGGVFFEAEQCQAVATAARFAGTTTALRITNVATFQSPSGVTLEVGYRVGAVIIRATPPDVTHRVRSTFLQGEELSALRRALEDLGFRS